MKNTLLLILLLSFAPSAMAAQAFWTGQAQNFISVTGQLAWRCQYSYGGQTFWQAFTEFCPAMIEVY